VTDDQGATATQGVTVTITGTNDAPVAVADTASATENQTLTIDVLANDTDVDDGHSFTLLSGSAPKGVVSVENGKLVFNPGSDFDHLAKDAAETVTLTYTMRDEHGAQSTSLVTVTITGTNDAPTGTASATLAGGTEDTAYTVSAADLLAGFSDVDIATNGDALSVSGLTADHGTVKDNGDGTFTITPAANYNGTVTLSYSVVDKAGASVPATQSFSLAAVNDAPVATNGTGATDEDTAVQIDVASLISDIETADADLTVTASVPAEQGTVSVNGMVITFTPAANFNGPASISYSVSDGQLTSATASIAVNVAPVNDAPVAVDIQDQSSDEDQPVAFTVPAFSDVDNASLTYSATLGNGDALPSWLSFDAASRTFSGTPPQDFNGAIVLKVTGSDGSLSASDTFTLTINPVNDAPVAVDDTGTVAEEGTVTIDVLANDTDVDGPSKTIASASVDPAQGTVKIESGKVVFTAAKDFNGDATITYTVSDGTLSDEGQAVVTVTPVNDAPVAQAGAAAGDEDTPITGSVTATDVDSASLTYSLVTGAVDGNGDPVTGLTFNADGSYSFQGPQDFNGPVTFTYRANDGALNSNVETVTLTVTPVNDAPASVSLANSTMAENAAGATIGTLSTTDVDAGDTHTYTVSDDRFEVVNGSLKLKAGVALDYETASTIKVTVTATDSGNLSKTEAFTITVHDQNEAPTALTVTPAAVNENDAGAPVASFSISDPDSVASGFATYTYKVLADDGTVDARFTVDDATGTIKLADGVALDFENPGDLSLHLQATNTQNSAHGVTHDFTVNLQNLNDVAPVFSSGATGSVNENAPTSTVIYQVAATDQDGTAFGDVTFSLGGADAGLLDINQVTGEVTLKAAANYEAKASYVFDVIASQGSGPTTTQPVTVSVQNLDEVAPTITSGATAAVNENVAAGSLVYTAAATDTDFNAPATASSVTYSLKSGLGDASAFDVNLSTGAVTIKASPDYETKSSYSFTVVATDAAGNATEKTVTLAINSLDEVAPTITSGTTATAINENSGTGQVIYTVTSDDTADISAGVTYSLKTGGDAAAFSIDSSTGAVTLTGNPDFETKGSYSFTVVASDGVNTPTEKTVALAINNVNEPATALPVTPVSVNENVAGATVATFTTSDPDTDPAFNAYTYKVLADNGTVDTRFTVDAATGAIKLATGTSLDFENPGDLSLRLQATNTQDTTQIVTQAFTVNLQNLNDEAPMWQTAASQTITEGTKEVTSLSATDSDGSSFGAVTYAITGGTDAALFEIVGGKLQFRTAPDYDTELKHSYQVQVTASQDNVSNGPDAVQLFAVTVDDDPGDNVKVYKTATFDTNAGTQSTVNGLKTYTESGLVAQLIDASDSFDFRNVDADSDNEFVMGHPGSTPVRFTKFGSTTFDFESVYIAAVSGDGGIFTGTLQNGTTVTKAISSANAGTTVIFGSAWDKVTSVDFTPSASPGGDSIAIDYLIWA
jgi:VCBS repeat-containing protein